MQGISIIQDSSIRDARCFFCAWSADQMSNGVPRDDGVDPVAKHLEDNPTHEIWIRVTTLSVARPVPDAGELVADE